MYNISYKIWCLLCKGSTTDCGSVSMGSNPINHPKGELPKLVKGAVC